MPAIKVIESNGITQQLPPGKASQQAGPSQFICSMEMLVDIFPHENLKHHQIPAAAQFCNLLTTYQRSLQPRDSQICPEGCFPLSSMKREEKNSCPVDGGVRILIIILTGNIYNRFAMCKALFSVFYRNHNSGSQNNLMRQLLFTDGDTESQ